MNDPNDHVHQYLKYYLTLDRSPHYGVMLTAPWGSGKTFQAKKLVSQIAGNDGYVLVSLNGMATQADLDNAVMAAVHPWTQGRGPKSA